VRRLVRRESAGVLASVRFDGHLVGTVTALRPSADRASGRPLLIGLATPGPVTERPGARCRGGDGGGAAGITLPAEVVRRRQSAHRDGAFAAHLTSWFSQQLTKAIPGLLKAEPLTGDDVYPAVVGRTGSLPGRRPQLRR
jgi:hypothetical protein